MVSFSRRTQFHVISAGAELNVKLISGNNKYYPFFWKSLHPLNIVMRFARQRDNNNVGSSDLTREFIATIAEITRNSYNTHFRVW
jgi:hypothetical protein